MAGADARKLRELEDEDGKPKKLPAEAMLRIESLKTEARGER